MTTVADTAIVFADAVARANYALCRAEMAQRLHWVLTIAHASNRRRPGRPWKPRRWPGNSPGLENRRLRRASNWTDAVRLLTKAEEEKRLAFEDYMAVRGDDWR